MTSEQARQKLIAWAQAQVGVREGTDNYNKYAENPELKRLYGWAPQNQPWCDVFVDVGFIECFGLESASRMTYQPIGAGSALCRQSAQYYRAEGAFSHLAAPGDQVFFFSNGDINHTGIVVRVYGGTIVTVEGNSSDMVSERTYSVNDGKIAGYGHPKWSIVSGEEAERPEDGAGSKEPEGTPGSNGSVSDNVQDSGKDARYYALRLPYLRRGDTGGAVIAVQFQLAAQGYDIGPDGADGDFGRRTEAAVGAFQGEVGLTPDGVVGPETGARLFGGEIIREEEDMQKAGTDAAAEPEAQAVEQTPGGFWNNLLAKIRGGGGSDGALGSDPDSLRADPGRAGRDHPDGDR